MDILKDILSKEKEKQELIKAFQERVWNGENYSSDERINEVLSDLAYDLDFYEPNETLRKESPSYYGNKRLEKEITEALEKIKSIKEASV